MSANDTPPNGRSPERETSNAEPEHERGGSQKRKASSHSPDDSKASQSPKRTRLEEDSKGRETTKASPTSKQSTTDRRENARQEERKRGKRLFGGLLSTLSQTTSSSQQKRRQEIERRQQARVHQQRAEDDKHREEKLAKLKAIREEEQIKFDERVMKTKHSNMLAMARFLETRSEPKIYYLPWDPTDEQDRIIKNQIRDTEDIIDKEVDEFNLRKERKLKALGIPTEPPPLEPKNTVGSKTNDEHPTDNPPPSNPTPATANRPPSRTGKVGHHEKEPDRADDVMIEEVEDTVIY
ncbi:pinin/SDK/memA/ protein conserved region-domain-containing protein [Hypoxylon trugodes]|uniref:pinin/SDK/memA/ protein conserved region-domain-containing protein n=1 Tax=Hypoxylon trugodes TaxID=326681 RepID=UPI0021941F63|nr:pinin/SDK/memA/ protein conserved region-domain-containing protein [Hypoxylon trugodes]KAI1384631.1 pinin/SDK/memA/ protein conserved region-domain-containing protein [Hypoxylon trugodes]